MNPGERIPTRSSNIKTDQTTHVVNGSLERILYSIHRESGQLNHFVQDLDQLMNEASRGDTETGPIRPNLRKILLDHLERDFDRMRRQKSYSVFFGRIAMNMMEVSYE
jgi:hypothetical protein